LSWTAFSLFRQPGTVGVNLSLSLAAYSAGGNNLGRPHQPFIFSEK